MNWPETLSKLISGTDLSRSDAEEAMANVMSGESTPAQIASFLVALRVKGETVDEMAGLAGAMLDAAEDCPIPGELLDTCGTGGDRMGTMNVSTLAAFVAAGAGVRVAKHGNRAASSRCGSADLLEAMGVEIDLPADRVRDCVEEAGLGFIFARRYHPAMRFAAPVRQEIGVPTVMNYLGPLVNPARPAHQAVGVARPEMREKMVGVLRELGSRHVLAFSGEDGLDELSLSGPSFVIELKDGEVREFEVAPEDFGLDRAPLGAIAGGDADANRAIAESVLSGSPGPQRDITLLNAAAGLVAADIAEDISAGVELARDSIDSGRAAAAAEKLIEVSKRGS